MSAERSYSLTIWMRREGRIFTEVPDKVKLCGNVARSRYEAGKGFMLSDSTKRLEGCNAKDRVAT